MTLVISENLVEYSITVLESSGVNRNNKYSGFEQRHVFYQYAVSIRYTRHDNIRSGDEILNGIGYFPFDIPV